MLAELHPDLSLQDLREVVDLVFGTMREALSEGRRVEIRGFGSFAVHPQKGRRFRNPKTGEVRDLAPSERVVYRPGSLLRSLDSEE